MTTERLDDVLRRPARHLSVDGLGDLMAGVLVALCGTTVIAEELLPSWKGSSAWAMMLGAVALLVLHRPLMSRVERVRARWIYPRVGYVKLRTPSRSRTVAGFVVSGVMAATMAFALARSSSWQALMPILTGGVCAVGAALFWMRLGLRRLSVYALLALVSGALAQSWLPPALGAGVVMCVAGLSWAIGGGLVLRALLSQPPATEAQG